MRRLLSLLTVGMLLIANSAIAEDAMVADFELPGSDGQTYKLSDLTKEKVVVIAWYPKAFTGG